MTYRTTLFAQKPSAYAALILIVMLSGCGGDDRVSAVHGIVTLDGKPIGDAGVTFTPKAGGRPAFGVTKADGSYELTTFEIGDGALIGNHVVTVNASEEKVSAKAKALAEEHDSLSELMLPKQTPKTIWRVPEPYSDSETSGLEFEVKRGEDNQADFALDSK